MPQFSQQEVDNSRAGRFSLFLQQNPDLDLIELSPAEKEELVKAPTPTDAQSQSEIALILVRAIQGNTLSRERIYSAYLKHPDKLVRKVLHMVTGRAIPYEIRSKLSYKEREEPYKIVVAENCINIRFENYLPSVNDGKGEVVSISLKEIDKTTGTHPLVSIYPSLVNRKSVTTSLSGAHRTRIRATLSLDETFNSDSWALVKLICTLADKSWQEHNVFVNLAHTKPAEIEPAAVEALNDLLISKGLKGYRILVDKDASDWGPLSVIQLQAKVKAETMP